MTSGPDHAVVLFDGECALCHRSVRVIAGHDRQGQFRFAPLAGTTAATLLLQATPDARSGSTVVLVEENGRVSTRSTAALRIAARLDWPWRALAILRLTPRPLRDAVYDLVARHRARWFGRAAFCDLSPDLRDRVLD